MSLHDSKMSYTFKETAADYCCNRRHLCQQFVINCTLIHAVLRRKNKIKKTQTYICIHICYLYYIGCVFHFLLYSLDFFCIQIDMHTCLVYFQAAIVHINIIFF